MIIKLINREVAAKLVSAPGELPRHMYGAFKGDEVIAVAGLRMAEHPVCMLDSMASNPACSAEDRNEALNGLTEAICSTARELQYTLVLACTVEDTIVRRALEHGFKQVNVMTIVKELN